MEIDIIRTTEALEAVSKTEVDLAISTAKNFPRNLEKSRTEILQYATASRETAESCFYHLPRAGKDIEGWSIRFAEIVSYCLGNINSAMRIVGNDGKKITSQAVAHDLERNNRVIVEVSRNILDKYGKTFSQDMQIVTGNAAGAIAWRNAIFKIVPKAMCADLEEKIKKFIVGDGKEMAKRKAALLKKFEGMGVDTAAICKALKVPAVDQIGESEMIKLYGVLTAINEGTATADEVFGTGPAPDNKDFSDDKADETTGELPLK